MLGQSVSYNIFSMYCRMLTWHVSILRQKNGGELERREVPRNAGDFGIINN